MSTTIQDHADAFLALLRGAAKPSAINIHDGAVPNRSLPPYALCYFSSNRPADDGSNDLSGASSTVRFRAILHCVGSTHEASRAVAQWAEAALLDQRPVITGRSCGLIRQDSAFDPERDESTNALVMDSIQTYTVVTTPA